MPRGPRRYLRPVAESMSQPIASTSRGICPADWQASRRKGTRHALAMRPIAAAGLTRPPLVGTWVTAMSFTRASIMLSRAATESWPLASLGTTSTVQPLRRATCK